MFELKNKILKAINKGLNEALDLDDFSEDDLKIQKKSLKSTFQQTHNHDVLLYLKSLDISKIWLMFYKQERPKYFEIVKDNLCVFPDDLMEFFHNKGKFYVQNDATYAFYKLIRNNPFNNGVWSHILDYYHIGYNDNSALNPSLNTPLSQQIHGIFTSDFIPYFRKKLGLYGDYRMHRKLQTEIDENDKRFDNPDNQKLYNIFEKLELVNLLVEKINNYNKTAKVSITNYNISEEVYVSPDGGMMSVRLRDIYDEDVNKFQTIIFLTGTVDYSKLDGYSKKSSLLKDKKPIRTDKLQLEKDLKSHHISLELSSKNGQVEQINGKDVFVITTFKSYYQGSKFLESLLTRLKNLIYDTNLKTNVKSYYSFNDTVNLSVYSNYDVLNINRTNIDMVLPKYKGDLYTGYIFGDGLYVLFYEEKVNDSRTIKPLIHTLHLMNPKLTDMNGYNIERSNIVYIVIGKL